MPVVFETKRLRVLVGENCPEHLKLFESLWSDPRVMRNVGFAKGMKVDLEQLKGRLDKRITRGSLGLLNRLLLVQSKSSSALMGECWLGQPGEDGVSETDVKLLPAFWGHGYGVEIKRGLLEFLFTETDCQKVKATPNKDNAGSIKMQESVGAVRVGSNRWEPPRGIQK